MYKFLKIRHDILIQCKGNYMDMRKFNYKYAWDYHFKKFSTKKFGCPEGCFPKQHPDALMAKTLLRMVVHISAASAQGKIYIWDWGIMLTMFTYLKCSQWKISNYTVCRYCQSWDNIWIIYQVVIRIDSINIIYIKIGSSTQETETTKCFMLRGSLKSVI